MEESVKDFSVASFWYQRGRECGIADAKQELYAQVVEALMFGPITELEVRLKRIFEGGDKAQELK